MVDCFGAQHYSMHDGMTAQRIIPDILCVRITPHSICSVTVDRKMMNTLRSTKYAVDKLLSGGIRSTEYGRTFDESWEVP